MSEEAISQEFRLKNTDEARSYFIEEINQNELMSVELYLTLIYCSFYSY